MSVLNKFYLITSTESISLSTVQVLSRSCVCVYCAFFYLELILV